MYSPIKDKITPPPSPRLYSSVQRLTPRYTKAYLWLCFLVFVFGSMLLYDNGISIQSILPRFGSQVQNETPASISQTSHPAHVATPTAQAVTYSPPTTLAHTSEETVFDSYGSGAQAFTPADVLIMFKTGATSLWRRVPMHLSTTLADNRLTPNIVFYSDQADNIAGRPIVDVLANVSDTLKASSDFELYRALSQVEPDNLYLENAAMEGDHYEPGGWRLDKYKFLPMMAHAAKNYPSMKWYIYMEDDNYYFWRSLYTWLAENYDPDQPFFLGSPAARLGEDFAHGGSGFIVSGAAMRQTFGSHPDLVDQYESFAVDRCCGDLTLSHVMKDYGVTRDRRHDHSGWVGLQAFPTWRMAFGDWNWCSPIYNVHKVHQADLSRLHVLERKFQAEFGHNTAMTWGQLFERTVWPMLSNETRIEWDNQANEKWYASKIEEDELLTAEERQSKPWYSMKNCQAACKTWDRCLSWKYQDDACGLSSTVTSGVKVSEGVRMTSAFMTDRIGQLLEKHCEDGTIV